MNYNLANAAPYKNDPKNIDNNSNIKNTKLTTGQNKRNVTFKNRHDNVKPKIKKEMIENLEVYKDDDDDDQDGNEYLPKSEDYLNENNNMNEPVQFNYKEQQNSNNSNNNNSNNNNIDSNIDKKNIDPPTTRESFAKLNSQYANDYYKQFSQYQGSYQIPKSSHNNNSDLLKKIDNILYLLEEQQEEKTNLVTEELILYVFLGIFVIYVLDSFVKVGKYTR